MNLDEFELQTRRSIEQILNQLQSAILMTAQLEIQLSETGRVLQVLSQQVEDYLSQQRQQTDNGQGNGAEGQNPSNSS